ELLNATRSTLKLDASHYTNVHVVTDAVVAAANSLLRADEVTQSRIDAEYAAIQNAISKLELTTEAANEKQFSLIPDMYRMMCHRPGTIETLHYQAPNPQHGKDDKKLHVYLPYGYDAADQSKKYNVLYLLHGGGENEDLLFGGPGENRELKRIIDHLIACGDMDPLIVVTPTFYGGMNDVALFHDELIHTIVPFVETRYNTY